MPTEGQSKPRPMFRIVVRVFLVLLALIVVVPGALWLRYVLYPKYQLWRLIEALPPGALDEKTFRPKPPPAAEKKNAEELFALAVTLPKNDSFADWPSDDPTSEKEWDKMAQEVQRQKATLARARTFLARSFSWTGLVCLSDKFTSYDDEPYFKIRVLSGLLAVEQVIAIRSGDRASALDMWLQSRPLTTFLDSDPCYGAVRADDNTHMKSLQVLNLWLDRHMPTPESLVLLRQTLQKPDNLDDKHLAFFFRFHRFLTDRLTLNATYFLGTGAQVRLDNLIYNGRAISYLTGPIAGRYTKLSRLYDWGKTLPSAEWANNYYHTKALFWEYEVRVEVRTMRTFALCALDAVEHLARNGELPDSRPEDCVNDELGNPFIYERSPNGFTYQLGGPWKWPDKISWRYHRPETGTVSPISKWNIGKEVTVVGRAANRKFGAKLVGDGFSIFIQGLGTWPEGVGSGGTDGKIVEVTGTLEEGNVVPAFIPKEGDPLVQGVPKPEGTDLAKVRLGYLITNARWSVKDD